MRTNADRSFWAMLALRAFARESEQGLELTHDQDSVIVDLLSALMHLHAETSSAPVKDFARLVERGRGQFECEMNGECDGDDNDGEGACPVCKQLDCVC